MKKSDHVGILDTIAEENSYYDKADLLRDYSFIPTVMMPKHKKVAIVPLIWKHMFGNKH